MAKQFVRVFAAIIAAVVVVSTSGCYRLMRNLQYSNVRSGLFPMNMDLTIGDGKTDARSLMARQTYAGAVERDDVRVHYPSGMAEQAARFADAFQQGKADVRARTGITWAFKPDLYLVIAADTRTGFRLRISLHGKREIAVPVLVDPGSPTFFDWQWSRGLAHELTEASMLASLDRREMVLGDYCWWEFEIVNGTRWFRDGVSDYAGDLMNARLFGERYQPPARIYRSLMTLRGGVLGWDNCDPQLDEWPYYDASLALFHELVSRSGEDGIARIMRAASEDKYINGRTLDRAVKKVTGLDLKAFLRDYKMTWLGADFADSDLLTGARCIAGPGNQVRVTRVYPRTPAEMWKLRPGDQVLAVDGNPVISSAWLVHRLAAHRPGDRITVELLVGGRRVSYRMKTAARYEDEL